ncbi:MAG: hypothetical protein PHF86_03550 [Candidatus Nanoarchaeia archaeon]|nr:hypothetical protein [Candidatus Nanoarchaeia archaeon]
MNLQKLRQKLNLQKNKIGLVCGNINIKEYDNSKNNISAGINPNGWNIEISLKKGFDPKNDSRARLYMKKKKIEDGLEKLISDVTTHEFAHWELPLNSNLGCPYSTYEHDKILEAVKEELPEDKKQHSSYVVNAFEDMIINPRCREYNKDFSGQVLFWNDQGLSCKGKYTPFYEAFIKLNMHLFGDRWDKALLKKYYTNDKKVDNAVKKVIQELNLPENIKDSSILFDKKKWPEMSKIFARNLSPLLDVNPEERLSAYDQGDTGNGENDKEEQKSGDNKKEQAGNGIEKKLKTKDGKEEVSYGRYSSNEQKSKNFTSFEQLDSLYKLLARDIPVRVEAMTKSNGLNISPLNYRPFDEDTDDFSKIKLSKLYVTEKGLTFGHVNQPLTINAKSKVQRRSFPSFKMVMIDNSGSMEQGINSSNIGNTNFIPWGDNSKYHHALLGFYGIENYLQKQGIAQYIEHGLSLFSNSTRFKQSNFSGIDEVRKLALAPEFGNTKINLNVLETALSGKQSFVLSLSDGEISDWDSQKNRFMDLAKQNYYAHIQIGNSSQFSNDLESSGIPVFYVNSGNDLSKLMVDITKKTYGAFVTN